MKCYPHTGRTPNPQETPTARQGRGWPKRAAGFEEDVNRYDWPGGKPAAAASDALTRWFKHKRPSDNAGDQSTCFSVEDASHEANYPRGSGKRNEFRQSFCPHSDAIFLSDAAWQGLAKHCRPASHWSFVIRHLVIHHFVIRHSPFAPVLGPLPHHAVSFIRSGRLSSLVFSAHASPLLHHRLPAVLAASVGFAIGRAQEPADPVSTLPAPQLKTLEEQAAYAIGLDLGRDAAREFSRGRCACQRGRPRRHAQGETADHRGGGSIGDGPAGGKKNRPNGREEPSRGARVPGCQQEQARRDDDRKWSPILCH